MREILFRAKLKEKPIMLTSNPFVYGGYFKHETRQTYPLGSDRLGEEEIKHLILRDSFVDWGFPKEIEYVEINHETLGQYTGLKDISGVKIFEGDIVEEIGHYVNSDKKLYQKIQWKESYSCWLRGEYQRLTPKNIKEYKIKVVGNIYDNSELLGE